MLFIFYLFFSYVRFDVFVCVCYVSLPFSGLISRMETNHSECVAQCQWVGWLLLG